MQQTSDQQIISNQQFINPNILQFRLDTDSIIQRLREFLSGNILVPERQPDGGTKFVKNTIGKSICNEKGVQHLTNYVQGLINPSVVQGNYEFGQYQNHVSRIHKSISRQLVCNYHEWGMQYDDLEMTNDFIMNLVETFLSRLIDNKERESYAQTLRSQESSRLETGGGLKGLFGGSGATSQ